MNKSKKKIVLSLISFSIITIINVLISTLLVFFLDKNDFTNLNLFFLLSLYLKKIITIQIFGFLELINICISFLILLKSNWYQAKEIQITEDIVIPERAGQNQHGSAKFADKKNYDDLFDSEIIDLQDYQNLLSEGNNVYYFIEKNKDYIDELINDMDI